MANQAKGSSFLFLLVPDFFSKNVLLNPLPVLCNNTHTHTHALFAPPENNLSYWRPAAESSPPNNETQHVRSTFFQNPLSLSTGRVCVQGLTVAYLSLKQKSLAKNFSPVVR